MRSDDLDTRLRPRRPRQLRDESEPVKKVMSSSYQNLMRLVRMTSRRSTSTPATRSHRKPYYQRCAVRLTYSSNRVRGQWAAHGRYISRESATGGVEFKEASFGATNDGINVAQRLTEWQRAKDERLFKLVVSPEFGDRLDLKRLARELMNRVESEIGQSLDWVAVSHHNTGHPHVHIAIRGVTDTGGLSFPREYVKCGFRAAAEQLCTEQLGFRTRVDAQEAERRKADSQTLPNPVQRAEPTNEHGSVRRTAPSVRIAGVKRIKEPER